MIDHLSYSSITSYLDCPENWRRKYIAKEATKSSPALVFGSAFHGAVEEQLLTGRSAREAWDYSWGRALEKDTVDWGVDTPEAHFNEGVRLLGHPTVAGAIDRLSVRSDEQGKMVERKITLNVPGVPIPIIGYIDFIASDGVPCDLKTSKASWNDAKAADSLQGLFYLGALNQAGFDWPGWRFRHVVFVKTKEPKVQVIETLHRPMEVMFLLKVIQQVWYSIQVESFPLNPGSWKCGPAYCDFWANCRGKYA